MKKDRVRDYATAAFRDYAVASKSAGNTTESQREDMTAVENMLKYFSTVKPSVVSAVKAVYFTDASLPFRKNTITLRVRNFAILEHSNERDVYRDLKAARQKFAEYRGLTVG